VLSGLRITSLPSSSVSVVILTPVGAAMAGTAVSMAASTAVTANTVLTAVNFIFDAIAIISFLIDEKQHFVLTTVTRRRFGDCGAPCESRRGAAPRLRRHMFYFL
jgi:hypothetical protein